MSSSIFLVLRLLYLKGIFVGLAADDAIIYLENFIGICTSYTIPRVDQEALRLKVFPFLLTEEESLWLEELPRGSITTWRELC